MLFLCSPLGCSTSTSKSISIDKKERNKIWTKHPSQLLLTWKRRRENGVKNTGKYCAERATTETNKQWKVKSDEKRFSSIYINMCSYRCQEQRTKTREKEENKKNSVGIGIVGENSINVLILIYEKRWKIQSFFSRKVIIKKKLFAWTIERMKWKWRWKKNV